jgi:hypothetical protein
VATHPIETGPDEGDFLREVLDLQVGARETHRVVEADRDQKDQA